jgi:hypothetical protein
MSMANIPVAPVLFLGLLLLPVRLSPPAIRRLAFALWLLGGLLMMVRGVLRFRDAWPATPLPLLYGVAAGAVLLGWVKGRHLLLRASQRNLARLRAIDAPLWPVQVYPARSWGLIGLFMLAGMSLGWMGAPMIWRGAVSVAVGLGLVCSSFAYVRA